MATAHLRWFNVLGAIYLAFWAWLAVSPRDRPTWALENLLTVVVCAVLFLTRRRFPFSRFSYCLWFAFLALHAIGATSTYSLVPYDAFFVRLTGWSPQQAFGWDRNNYDRAIHFFFGLLLSYPAREIVLRIANVRGFWGYFVPLMLMVSMSSIYELTEWAAALVFGGDLGTTYLGTQGDEWDAQKDVALGGLGGLITMTLTALVNARLQRDFAREWAESLRVKHKKPLGEDAVGAGRA